MHSWTFYLLGTLASLAIQSFFVMLEMACISFNKVRLHYYISKGQKRAQWLGFLLNRPPLFFGTSLIMITASLQVGSECARLLYASLGLHPSLAILMQTTFVLIFAEIGPMLAGRRFAEHVAMLGLPLLYAVSIVLRPVVWLLDRLCRVVHRLFGIQAPSEHYLSREELQQIIEEREEGPEKFSTVVGSLLSLKAKSARDLMSPLTRTPLMPLSSTAGELRALLATSSSPFVVIYQKAKSKIAAIAYPRDLIGLASHQKIEERLRSPWFIAETAPLFQILKQFRLNHQSVAIVLNEVGRPTGILTLDEILDEIFHRSSPSPSSKSRQILIDRSFHGDMKIAAFNAQFGAELEAQGAETLEELIALRLGHPPLRGESVRVGPFELVVEESPLFGPKVIAVHTL